QRQLVRVRTVGAAAGGANGAESVDERARATGQHEDFLVTAQRPGGWGGPAKPEGGDERAGRVGPPEIREKERDEAEECRDFGEGQSQEESDSIARGQSSVVRAV